MRLRSAETLRALMRQQNLSLSGLASAAQCSKSFISHLLSGRRNTCTDGLADRIAAALDVPTRVILVPTKSTTDRQIDYRLLPLGTADPSDGLGSTQPGSRPGPRPAGSQSTNRKAWFGSRCGWVPQRVLLGSRGRAVEWPSGSLHRRPLEKLVTATEAISHLTEVTHHAASKPRRADHLPGGERHV